MLSPFASLIMFGFPIVTCAFIYALTREENTNILEPSYKKDYLVVSLIAITGVWFLALALFILGE